MVARTAPASCPCAGMHPRGETRGVEALDVEALIIDRSLAEQVRTGAGDASGLFGVPVAAPHAAI